MTTCVRLAVSAAVLASCASSPDAPIGQGEKPDSVAQCEEALAQLGIEGSVFFASEGDPPIGYPRDSTICGYQTADGSLHDLLVRPDEPPQLLPDTPGANPLSSGD